MAAQEMHFPSQYPSLHGNPSLAVSSEVLRGGGRQIGPGQIMDPNREVHEGDGRSKIHKKTCLLLFPSLKYLKASVAWIMGDGGGGELSV